MDHIRIPAADLPVVDEVDVCVVGGSCTGVFAAVRAARLGARVALVERQGFFGGVATLVCTWHTLMDAAFERQIIAGLTAEVLERLRARDALFEDPGNPSRGYVFRPGELKLVLDDLVGESGVRPRLHTQFVATAGAGDRAEAAIIEDKTGRRAIRARAFIDATGDGDLCRRLGLADHRYDALLPPTTCAFLAGCPEGPPVNIGAAVREHGEEFGLAEGFVWGSVLPGTDVYMLAGTRVPEVDCSVAEELTAAEIDGRRQVRAIMDLLRKHHPSPAVLYDLPATIGIRDTRHIRGQHQVTGEEVLYGRRFEDAVVNGSYRVDVHHQDRPGVTFRYLDGTEVYLAPGRPKETGRWREPVDRDPTFYQAPLRSLIPAGSENVLAAGRMLDADRTAFSALRVMVNTNQMGEAAGVAAWAALDADCPVTDVDPARVRSLLAAGGSIVV
jgi:hypothetical protein